MMGSTNWAGWRKAATTATRRPTGAAVRRLTPTEKTPTARPAWASRSVPPMPLWSETRVRCHLMRGASTSSTSRARDGAARHLFAARLEYGSRCQAPADQHSTKDAGSRNSRPASRWSTSPYKPSPVSRPSLLAHGGDHSSRVAVARHLKRPTRRLERAALLAPAYAALLPMGFAVPPALPPARWALTPPFHPCRRAPEDAATAVSFLWHSPRRFRHRALPGIVLYGARTFLPWCPGSLAGIAEHHRRSPERRRRRECASSGAPVQRSPRNSARAALRRRDWRCHPESPSPAKQTRGRSQRG
jgi:hypothetical protein